MFDPIFLISPLQVLEGCNKVSTEPSLLQAEQPQLSQPFPLGEVLQPSHHFCGPPLDLPQQVLSCAGGSRAGCRTPVGVSQEWSREAGSPCLDLLAMLLLVQTRTQLAFWAASAHWWLMSSFSPTSPFSPPSPSRQGCSQALHPPVCIDTRGFPDPGAGPCTWPC